MKTLILSVLTTFLSIAFVPNDVKAASEPVRTHSSSQSEQAEVLLQRLEVIKNMDKSTLTKADKKALRKEVRSIDKELHRISGGVYISASALIIILILLIIFT